MPTFTDPFMSRRVLFHEAMAITTFLYPHFSHDPMQDFRIGTVIYLKHRVKALETQKHED